MKVLICSDSELLLQLTGMSLESAGHQVILERSGLALVPQVPGAAALLVDLAVGRQAAALLRHRGFSGRVFLVGEGAQRELKELAQELHLDGAIHGPAEPDFAERFAAAVVNGRKVLIVDDSEIIARLLEEELTAKGFQIQHARDAQKATSIILKRATRPDLILLDINLPKVDGGQFCRFVKKNEMFRSIKVLFCSSENKARMEQLVAECGADGYLSKSNLLGKWIVENA